MYRLLPSKKIQCSVLHPESNWGLEWSSIILAEYLRHYVQEDQRDWDE